MLASLPAFATLVVDVRVQGGSGDQKSATASGAGQVITLQVYGTVTGTDSNTNEGLQSFFGSFVSTLSSGGSAIGDFSAWVPAAPFNSTSQPGKQQDLNGQPGLDLGSFNTASSVANDYIQGRAGTMITADSPSGASVTAAGDSTTFLLGTVQWTVTSLPDTGTTTLNFVPRTDTNGSPLNVAALWQEDGTETANNRNPTTSTYAAGSVPVTVAVPEPSCAGLFGLTVTMLMARRLRRRPRASSVFRSASLTAVDSAPIRPSSKTSGS
jgi:hypothetical protein